MDYKEVKMNLFSINKTADTPYCLAHCISADFAMAGGIAVDFVNRWNMRNRLRAQYGNQVDGFERCRGKVLPVEVKDYGKDIVVYNLLTKKYVYQKPEYANISAVLKLMREDMISRGITRVAMPKIGCGIDCLLWRNVSEIVKYVFSQTDIEVRVCYL
jgi:hypothetical protein